MDFHEFVEYAKEKIAECLPEEYQKGSIRVYSLADYTGLTVDLPDDDTMISPVINLEAAFEEVEKYGVQPETCVKGMAEALGEGFSKREELYGLDLGMDNIRNYLFAAVVNPEKADLSGIPHRKINDLAVIAKSWISENATVTITDQLAEQMGMDAGALLEEAENNTKKIAPPILSGLDELITSAFPKEIRDEPLLPPTSLPMYVLTNESYQYGAYYLADQELLSQISRTLGNDLFILPSSVHEILIIPENERSMLPDIKQMVEEVNRTVVSRRDFLSDNVYVFERKSMELKVYTGEIPRELPGKKPPEMKGPVL